MPAPTIECHDGKNFILTFTEGNLSRTLEVPVNRPELLAKMLLANHKREGRAKIGEDGSPIQYMIEKWLNENEARVDVREGYAKAEAAREKYGSLFDEIEI